MEHICCERHDALLLVTLQRGKANALNGAMVEELNSAFDQAAGDESIRGVVLLSGCRGFFCGGFDVNEVFDYDRETMTLFFARFIDLYETVHLLPKPVVAAISGHAVAAGAVLALSSDLRIVERGEYSFALNEINFGVVLPPGIIRMVLTTIPPGTARELLLSGAPLRPERAFELGIANELLEPAQARERALERCLDLAHKPKGTFAGLKHTLRELAGHRVSPGDRNLEAFMDHWFSEDSRLLRRKLAADLKSRKPGTSHPSNR
jgi:enoyl-CoA hydratase/carnithine racemase